MKIACTGSTGRVGRLLVKQGVVPLSCDVTNHRAVWRAVHDEMPDVVIHLAGITNVDYCEVPEHWEEVRKVNFNGTMNVVKICNDRQIPVVYVSSEHVFPSSPWWRPQPYKETQPVAKVGVNNYALTKIACEGLRYAFPLMRIVRTSYLFDWVRLMSDELVPAQNIPLHYPTFIHRSYIYLPHFAQNLLRYVEHLDFMSTPILHLAGSKTVSQYQFMREFVDYFRLKDVQILPRHHEYPVTPDSPLRATRPHRCGLDVSLSVSLGLPAFSYQDGFQQMEKDVPRG